VAPRGRFVRFNALFGRLLVIDAKVPSKAAPIGLL